MLQTRINIVAVGVAVTVSESDELFQLGEDPGREARDGGDSLKHHRLGLPWMSGIPETIISPSSFPHTFNKVLERE